MLAGLAFAGDAQAQTYPDRIITLVAATAPGGPGDITARQIADKMSPILGQQIVVENVGGAGGVMGSARVARAKPDGYTLLVHQTGITIAPSTVENLPYNVEKDLVVVGLVNLSYSILVGRKSLPANNINELLTWMRGPGKPAKIAFPGVGSHGHLQTVLFGQYVGADINAVPYRGIGPAMTDVLGGHVDLVWAGAAAATPLIKSGEVKAYVYGGPKRTPLLPDLPALGDLPNTESQMLPFWHALFAPAGTPQPIIDKLNAALREALKNPQLLKTMHDSGVDAFPPEMQTPAAGQKFVLSEVARWSVVGKTLPKAPAQ